jgi:hypothetical protein
VSRRKDATEANFLLTEYMPAARFPGRGWTTTEQAGAAGPAEQLASVDRLRELLVQGDGLRVHAGQRSPWPGRAPVLTHP